MHTVYQQAGGYVLCLCALCLINTLSVYGKLLQNVYQNFNFSAEPKTQIMRYLIKLYGLKKEMLSNLI